jgi:LysM repeat protein
MSYFFFLDETLLPVPPSKMQMKINNKNRTLTLINDGEINILKTPGLTEVSFQALLPNSLYPFATYFDSFHKADYYLDKLEKLKTNLKTFQFICSRMKPGSLDVLFDTSLTVTLEDYEIIEDATDNGFDVTVDIKLKQYRPYATKIINVKTTSDGTKTTSVERQRQTNKTTPKTHTVKKGDTLREICKKELGDGSKWRKIAKLNGITNPKSLQIGRVIKLE